MQPIQFIISHFRISRERFKVVHRDIADGSEPGARFYIMVAVSTGIACFGLLANSTAVVIGAMLVAPLMTPIFGMSLALVRGDTRLLGRSVQAEVVGVATSVSMGVLLGWMIGDFQSTPEMLARTQPNLFDLLVAVLSGFAGAYALLDEKISPALPGVAIATAIVPPLANSGLCFSIGEVRGGMGSFLLFFANFLSILLVASATFTASGMARIYGERPERREYLRRFSIAIVAFVIITVFLTGALMRSIREQNITNRIYTTLGDELGNLPSAGIDNVHHYTEKNRLFVLANIHTSGTMTPSRVKSMQERLSADIGMPTRLTLRSARVANITAQGDTVYDTALELDGTFGRRVESPELRDLAITEQILREQFESRQSVYFHRVEFFDLSDHRIAKAYVSGSHRLREDEVLALEKAVRAATGDNTLVLIVGTIPEYLQSSRGLLRYGWMLGDKATPERLAVIEQIKSELIRTVDSLDGFFITNINVNYLDEAYHFLLEVVGSSLFPQVRLDEINRHLAERFPDKTVNVYLWSRPEVVLTPAGAMSFETVYRQFAERQRENLPVGVMPGLDAIGY
jgi:uncharacterized hydrophobic protein (TIGR00271 family)